MKSSATWLLTATLLCAIPPVARSQTVPPDGIRQNTPAYHAFINARIVTSPGKSIENGILVIRDGVIESVGSGPPPEGARVRDMKGMTIYAGLIDSYSDYGLPKAPQRQRDGQQEGARSQEPTPTGPLYWNPQVRTQVRASDQFKPDATSAEKLRASGFTSSLIVPTRGIFRGASALVHTGNGSANEMIIRDEVAQHVSFQKDPGADGYPESLMGSIALVRQTLFDADWYAKAREAYSRNTNIPAPETNEALASLQDVLTGKLPIVIETSTERDLLRAAGLAKEFKLKLIVRGSGFEYRRLDAVRATQTPVILPVNFPEPPVVEAPEDALNVSLIELRHWDEAPENPQRLQSAGVTFALTTATLKDGSTFLTRVRKAVSRGLSKDDALASLTTTPAALAGASQLLGSLERGKIADFIITDGDLFSDKTKIRETWVAGARYVVAPLPETDVRGTWELDISGLTEQPTLRVKGSPDAPRGTVTKTKEVKLTSLLVEASLVTMTFTGDSVGMPGVVRMTAAAKGDEMTGTGEWSDGTVFTWSALRTAAFVPEPDTTKATQAASASFPPSFPPGEFGRGATPAQPDAVLVRNATIWTCGPEGKMENADLLIRKGKISAVGTDLTAPTNAVVIDGTGKHVTPGLIDAHSHTATDGNVNEAGQAISAEVRIGDVIDCDDISIYRQLAGGLTCAHVLHGSANPIGGQAQLIKLRWGMLPEEMKFDGAPPTIKFALGENVKQSNWGDNYTTRYPQTRMGVEQIMRDEFRAALDYEHQWAAYGKTKSGVPPRRDLELETALEIIRGKRFVHCHSYRQDEILAMMRVAEEFGFRVRVFQHILEGYKVADIMASHGAGGSSFSDWWAYKLEVYDAIPYNGAIMHNEGVLVSFNSDSDELARRLNTEAAKAVRYGGVPEAEALKFVTLNPAKQLMVDKRVGSLENGKDADFVIWSSHPLSSYSMCEQTWIDGRRFFDREEDRKMNDENRRQRSTLIQKVLAAGAEGGDRSEPRAARPGLDEDEHYSCHEEGH
jgi:imidazolonepropionase-like amidohydrolase